ncbi:uncharacterized protein MELLADRAFT_101062 [Melampsora larici-populina 98AG31]|uniref:Uncharacterized protein n=1 Tax=Melampsora larici-populina (strain 98AG31 / pathotype 3-4-7) TaxID=747676 RepID=F4R3H8_MELLP|nr:uncharacterized protein MELLADRAFT_101062 [Melampsora larici-populina 98AG31]EGG12628.1 hypothetical protein MELLADRAFT_101062 [Melampsora larici-populina 98AG31]
MISADVFNNYHNARIIQSAAVVPPDGRYVFSNVATGHIIHHDRKHNVPNIYSAKFVYPRGRLGHRVKRPQLALRAHKMGTKWISLRTPLDGKDSTKCISAQWDEKTDGAKGGADHAGTLYECVVDPLNLGASLEKTKQWWLLMPVETAKSLKLSHKPSGKSRAVQADPTEKVDDISEEAASLGLQRSTQPNDSPKGLPFWNTKTNRMETLPPWKYDKRSLKETEPVTEPEDVASAGNMTDGTAQVSGAEGEEPSDSAPRLSARHDHHSPTSSSTKLGAFFVIAVILTFGIVDWKGNNFPFDFRTWRLAFCHLSQRER